MHTHYDNLKVARNAPPAVIKAAYRALSQQYHPDRNSDPGATRIMKILNDAWTVLGDSEARAAYDLQLAAKEARAQNRGSQSVRQADITPENQSAQKNGRSAPLKQNKSGQKANGQHSKRDWVILALLCFVALAVFVGFCASL